MSRRGITVHHRFLDYGPLAMLLFWLLMPAQAAIVDTGILHYAWNYTNIQIGCDPCYFVIMNIIEDKIEGRYYGSQGRWWSLENGIIKQDKKGRPVISADLVGVNVSIDLTLKETKRGPVFEGYYHSRRFGSFYVTYTRGEKKPVIK
jgi:hypothetical protein